MALGDWSVRRLFGDPTPEQLDPAMLAFRMSEKVRPRGCRRTGRWSSCGAGGPIPGSGCCWRPRARPRAASTRATRSTWWSPGTPLSCSDGSSGGAGSPMRSPPAGSRSRVRGRSRRVPGLVRSRDAVARDHRPAGGPVRFRDWCRPVRPLDRGGMRSTHPDRGGVPARRLHGRGGQHEGQRRAPTLAQALAADETTLQWIVESYVLAFAALLLLGGAAADRFGPEATMRAGLSGSRRARSSRRRRRRRVCWSTARVLTGLAAALVMPATLAAVAAWGAGDRSRAVGGWTGVVALGRRVRAGRRRGAAGGCGVAEPVLAERAARARRRGGTAAQGAPRYPPSPGSMCGQRHACGVLFGVVAAATEAPRHPWLVVPASPARCSAQRLLHAISGAAIRCCRWTCSGRESLRVSAGALSAMFAAIFGIAFLLPQYLQLVRGVGPLGTGLYVLAYAFALVVASLAAGAVPAAAPAPAGDGRAARRGCGPRTDGGGPGPVDVGMGAHRRARNGRDRHRARSDPADRVAAPRAGPRTGLGSALNDAVREVGGVVGVAVLGSHDRRGCGTGGHRFDPARRRARCVRRGRGAVAIAATVTARSAIGDGAIGDGDVAEQVDQDAAAVH